ncbi:MAG: DUF1249 domain-containing protein [Gammaproteobacteria bacterium]|nr:DUF1249 domain-containing protein [Gammaproteobacteria bacterium]
MSATIQRKVLTNSTPLYEENYQRLKACFPTLSRLSYAEAVSENNTLVLRYQLEESFKYTSIISLSLVPTRKILGMPACDLQLRMYHDAHLVEVIACQGEYRFLPQYDYPNSKMYQRNEKYQINQLLRDLLIFCQRMRFHLLESCVQPT